MISMYNTGRFLRCLQALTSCSCCIFPKLSPVSAFMNASIPNSSRKSNFSSFAQSSRSGGRESGYERENDRRRPQDRGGGGGRKDKIDALRRLLTRILRHIATELRLNMRGDDFVKVEDLFKLDLKTSANIQSKSHTIDDVREASQSLLLGSKEAREKDERDRSEVIDDFYDPFYVRRGIHYKMCNDQYAPRRNIVVLYARLGLHRYNFLQGKNLQLSRIEKYIKSWGSTASTYCITLKAKDPETSGSLQTFQAQVNEQKYGRFLLMCTMARPLGGEDVDCVAIVRRILDEQTEVLRLVGHTQSSQTIKP